MIAGFKAKLVIKKKSLKLKFNYLYNKNNISKTLSKKNI